MSGYGQGQQGQQGQQQYSGQQQFTEQQAYSDTKTYSQTSQTSQGQGQQYAQQGQQQGQQYAQQGQQAQQYAQQQGQQYAQQGQQQGQQYAQQGQQYAADGKVQAQAVAGAAHEDKGFFGNMKDKLEHTSKTKLALGALAGAAVIGGAVAGGVALKHHHDEKVHQEEEAKAHTQSATSSSSTTTTTTSTTTTTMQVIGNTGDNKVRYGSKIALKHNMTGRFLRYNAANPRSNTSGQTIVVAGGWDITDSEYWQVVGSGNAGNVIGYGSTIRLKHISTGIMLHSHNHRSICSGQQEVSGFSSTDENDDWVVERWEGGSGDWVAEEGFRLVHTKTRVHLHSHDVLIQGQNLNEVTGFSGDVHDENSRWRACW